MKYKLTDCAGCISLKSKGLMLICKNEMNVGLCPRGKEFIKEKV